MQIKNKNVPTSAANWCVRLSLATAVQLVALSQKGQEEAKKNTKIFISLCLPVVGYIPIPNK